MGDIKNILKNATRLGAGKELLRKAVGKYLEPSIVASDVLDWCESHTATIEEWIEPENLQTWTEAQQFAERMTREAADTLARVDVQLGGGGHYAFLYFLTRLRKPEVVVETGVAAGFSSKAILSAMAANGQGKLYSSDFPYCRLEKPEKYIGILVNEDLKKRWKLYIKGDRENLVAMTALLSPNSVGLFHYDSDKSYSGREFAYQTIQPYLSNDSICIFDDIQNNWHFRDFVNANDCRWKVFEFGGKYLGLTQQK